MLIGVAFKYGKDSIEYEMAGGVRKSDRVCTKYPRPLLVSLALSPISLPYLQSYLEIS